jgi:hypothetical protein
LTLNDLIFILASHDALILRLAQLESGHTKHAA